MITLCAIASGSNGNCYYIGNEQEAVLVDAGISARQIVNRMTQQGLEPQKIRALFISHEHTDHVRGARVLARRLKIPVFITSGTFMALVREQRPDSPRFFEPGACITIGSFQIYPFLKNHDAAEPCSFRIENKDIHIGVLTDIGSITESVITHLATCHALFLETNYDEQMLWNGSYPWPLKKRIASDQGHLSNDQAFELLQEHSGKHLRAVFLSHLSAENNTREKAFDRFITLQDRFRILITSRYGPSDVLNLS
jgi:phosphoribosyl 1,2-cyclic phosphodiesterase